MGNEEVIITDTAFDVPSNNYDEFDQEINPARMGSKLRQTNTLKGTAREYQFYASDFLLLSFTEKNKTRKFRVNLAALCSEPDHNKVIVWKWLYFALATAALTGLCIFLTLS